MLTVVFGLVYPLVMTGFAQVAFRSQANGSLITVDGKVVGSKLAAQEFTKPQYFHERPSATVPAYNAGATTFSNLGPTSPALRKAGAAAKIARDPEAGGPVQPRPDAAGIPVDAVTTSGSGIDPDISPAYANLQARADRGGAPPTAGDGSST